MGIAGLQTATLTGSHWVRLSFADKGGSFDDWYSEPDPTLP